MKTSFLAVPLFILIILPLTSYSTESAPPAPVLTESGENIETTIPSPEKLPEPEVTIVGHGEERIEEYRMGGHLYMIKVTPRIGPSYYLVDTDGDGNFETRQASLEPNFFVPMWILFSW
ncbi:conserved hypothetical protein [Gammaproteobacteria bacterium]